jgi:molybdopterin synthase sulfur carrier subunit
MQVKVRLFDRLRDATGRSALSMDMQENSTLRELVQQLSGDEGTEFSKLLLDPATKALQPRVSILVNGRHCRFINGLETRLREGDLVDIMTAMSGG